MLSINLLKCRKYITVTIYREYAGGLWRAVLLADLLVPVLLNLPVHSL